jgi:HTH-type transcriptional regulator/antitoxin HigA
MKKKHIPSINIHIGKILEDELQTKSISQLELSKSSGIAKTIINEIIKGKRNMNAEYAVRLEISLGIDAEFWMNYQSNYDIWKERKMVQIIIAEASKMG